MNDARGFTLIETLIAFTLLALVLAGAFRVFDDALSATGRAEARLDALAQAKAILASAAPDGAGQTDLSISGWSRRLSVSTVVDRPGLYRLEARVGPEAGGGAPVVLITWRPAS